MWTLFFSRSTLKKFQNLRRKIFEIISGIPWRRVILISIVSVIVIGLCVFADIFICSSYNGEVENDKSVNIEEIVLSHENEIVDMASAYLSNYDTLTNDAKDNLELEFDEVEVTFEKNSDEKIIISAENLVNTVKFSLKENKLEKIETQSDEDDGKVNMSWMAIILLCVMIDLLILCVVFFICFIYYVIVDSFR